MFTIEILQTATFDLEDAYEWYEQQSEGLGDKFIREVDHYLLIIKNNPYQFSIQFSGQYRFANLIKFPYRLVYSIDEPLQCVYVNAVFHTSRNPEKF